MRCPPRASTPTLDPSRYDLHSKSDSVALAAGRLLTVSPPAKPSSISSPNRELFSRAGGNPRAIRQFACHNAVNFIAKPFRFGPASTVFISHDMLDLELLLLT
jgi:hypothetical protein